LKESRKSEDQQSNFGWPTRRVLGRKAQVTTARTFWDRVITQLSTNINPAVQRESLALMEQASSSGFHLWTSGSAGRHLLAGTFWCESGPGAESSVSPCLHYFPALSGAAAFAIQRRPA
jgi:hypothetical protein